MPLDPFVSQSAADLLKRLEAEGVRLIYDQWHEVQVSEIAELRAIRWRDAPRCQE